MQQDNNESELDAKLFYNSLLFIIIRKNKSSENKIAKISKYLDNGADVNATDANNKNNTPLHVAVLKQEFEVVKFLLERGADVSKKNNDNETALDIARLFSTSNQYIVAILESYGRNQQTSNSQETNDTLAQETPSTSADNLECKYPKENEQLPKSQVTPKADTHGKIFENPIESQIQHDDGSVKHETQTQNSSHHQQRHREIKAKSNKVYQYQKRSGTSGLSGQLYETKLLSLIIFRALYVNKVNKFLIATNVDGLGAFDDIVFRYHSDIDGKPRIMFIQAKHRDNPAKDKLTVEEVSKVHGDFSLHKYLESYIKISQTFLPETNDDMFRGDFKNMNCDFIIYTSAFENFTKKKSIDQTEGERFIKTSAEGKIFKFDYDDEDIQSLVQTVAKSRAVLLAKRLSKFMFKDNYANMMLDDLIKTYHVFLAQNVLSVEIKVGESQNNFLLATFKESFFTTKDNLLSAFKTTIYKEVSLKKNIPTEKRDEVENHMKSMTFKVSANFGNVNFSFLGSDQKKQRRLNHLCLKFKKLFEKANILGKYFFVKVDDGMVGPNEILQSSDLETYRLGGLVGNLLIFDAVTKTLKLNTEKDTLSEDNLKLYERLEQEIPTGNDIKKYRFDINVHLFPRLSLVHKEYDEKLIKEFLNKLTFYTNQATEDHVEKILKTEIDTYFISKIPRQSDALFKLRNDAIFLKVHDRIQKWWKHPDKVLYLTESCEFFFHAEQDILNSSLLTVLNFIFIKTIKKTFSKLEFKDSAIELLALDEFFNHTPRILNIISEENALSCMKVLQYFRKKTKDDICFLDLDNIEVKNCFDDVHTEIKVSKLDIIIIVSENKDNIAKINKLVQVFKKKIIIASNWDLSDELNETADNIIKNHDNKTSLLDLINTMRQILLTERYVVFQGKEVPLGVLFQDESYHLINSIVLYKIINDEKITIGNFFNNPSYDEILEYYIKEKVCRYITLDANKRAIADLNILRYDDVRDDFKPDTRDIVFIAEKYEEYVDFIKKYKDCNVHWFSISDEHLVWQHSRGSLENLTKHIQRGSHDAYTLQPVTLKDFREKVVIISGEPGMGKSSLLTHLAINTKNKYPELWISKISLLENINELKRWQKNKVDIDMNEVVKFLFRVIGFETYKGSKESKNNFENIVNLVSFKDDDIQIDKTKALNVSGSNLLEIELFIHSFNHGRVALLFDGFDEICPDFANEFMQLVNMLKKSKIAHLWVTSRLYNVLSQLENQLETFSFTIQPFSYNDQIEFLVKIWWNIDIGRKFFPNKNFRATQTKVQIMTIIIHGFLSVISAVLRETNNQFVSIPLHLHMISEIFKDSFHTFPLIPESSNSFISNQATISRINLNQLYERFVEAKFYKIRFGEKKPFLCIDDPDMRKLVNTEFRSFLDIHKKIAAYVIFDKTHGIEFFDKRDIKEIREFTKGITLGEEKTGIIEQMIRNEPKFVHFTFAEYFAVEFLWDMFKYCDHVVTLWTFLFDNILQSGEGGVRRFFNAKLGKDPFMFDLINDTELNVMFETFFFKQHKLAMLLYIAIDEHAENNVIFLLKCLKSILNEENLNNFIDVLKKCYNKSCLMCVAVERSAIPTVKFIIELIKDIDATRLIDIFHCSDLPVFNPVLLTKEYINGLSPNRQMFKVLMDDLSPSVITELFQIDFVEKKIFSYHTNIQVGNTRIIGPTSSAKLIHILTPSLDMKELSYFDKLNKEQLLNIFSAVDSNGKLPAHIAAAIWSYEFFDKLESLLDKSDFKRICTTVDNEGSTPIQYFKYHNSDCDKLKTLLNKVYGDNPNPELTLDYFIKRDAVPR